MPAGIESQHRGPQYLASGDEPSYRIRCPIHGFIWFSEHERRIIDHPLFQRLRFIRQLALTEYLYPGATHTRFEHSLGVMEVATRAFDTIARRQGALLEEVFKHVAGWEDKPLAQARRHLRAAALLHDVGHVCFSHAAEELLHQGRQHEKLTVTVLSEPGLMGADLDDAFGNGAGELLTHLIDFRRESPVHLKLLHDLISGEMDADRMDYLLRDSHHCGVSYGRFDHLRLLDALRLYSEGSEHAELVLHEDGLHALEALIIARFQMSTQVYLHPVRRIYDHHLREYLRTLSSEEFSEVNLLLSLTDVHILYRIFGAADDTTASGHKWAERIRHRDHFRLISSTPDLATRSQMEAAARDYERWTTKYPELEFYHDVARGSFHRMPPVDDLVRSDESGTNPTGGLRVQHDRGELQHALEASRLLQALPQTFQCARIFGSIGRNNIDLRDQILAGSGSGTV